jgi:hypothetical protein
MRKFKFLLPKKWDTNITYIKGYLFILLLFFVFNVSPLIAQNKMWIQGNKLINLSNSFAVTSSNLPTPAGTAGLVYNGSIPTRNSHVEYDANYNVLFFIIDGRIYNRDGYLLVKRETSGHVYEDYPDHSITINVVRVPNQCDKFYILGNYDDITAPAVEVRHFFLALLDLSIENAYYPNDPTKQGGLIDWDNAPPQYPVDLFNLTHFSAASNPASVLNNEGCFATCGLQISAPGNPGQNQNTLTYFTALKLSNNDVALSTAQHKEINSWLLKSDGIYLIGENACNATSNNIPYFYERLNMVNQSGGSFNTIPTLSESPSGGAVSKGTYNNSFTQLSCVTLNIGLITASECTSDGSRLILWPLNGTAPKYISTTSSNPIQQSFPNITSISNVSSWNQGCAFVRNTYQGTESIYVFHINGVDVIKDIANPTASTYIPNVITTATPQIQMATINNSLGYNFLSSYSTITGSTSLNKILITPNQLYDRDDSYLSTPACCEFLTNQSANGNITITTNTTWSPSTPPFGASSGPINISGDVILMPGAVLTIDNLELRFSEESDIIVNVGAVLKVRNYSKLTSYSCDGVMWKGIDVLGNPSVNQVFTENPYSPQGVVNITNSIIEHAVYGVEVGTTNSNAGGLVIGNNASFLNCRNGVRYFPYTRVQYGNWLSSKWMTSQALKNPVWLPGTMVYVSGLVNPVTFNSCTFVNSTSYTEFPMANRNVGIYTVNSSVIVNGTNLPYLNPGSVGTSFYRLRMGVQASTTSSVAFRVKRMNFQDCNVGISATNFVGNDITENNFQIPNIAYITNVRPRGVIMSGCSGFIFRSNIFSSPSQNANSQHIGALIANCGGANNLSYRNEFSNLWKGQEVQGNNATASASTGLALRCNKYVNCQYDQYLGDEDYWRPNQGDVDQITRHANNYFSLFSPSCQSNLFDMFVSPIRTQTTWYFNYFRPNNENYIPNSSDPNAPNCQSPHMLNSTSGNFVNITNPNFSLICPFEPDDFVNQEGLVMLSDRNSALETAMNNYLLTVDKNSKTQIESEIHAAFPMESQLLKDLLLEKSPLSDDIMKQLIQKIEIIDPWHLTQVLLTNSPLTKDVMVFLEENNVLSPFFMNFIHDSQLTGVPNYRALLEFEIASRQTDLHLASLYLLENAYDSNDPNLIVDEMKSLYEQYPSEDANKWNLSVSDEFTSTHRLEVLNDLLESSNTKDWAMLKEIELSVNGDWNTISETQLNQIFEIATNKEHGAHSYACAILSNLGEETDLIEPEIPIELRSVFSVEEKNQFLLQDILLATYPNPASEKVYITYPKEADEIGMLSISNSLGQNCYQTVLKSNGILELDLLDFKSGVYLIELLIDEKTIDTVKFVKL